jgi:VIT1/CCC1 family predicted Fe2+/Mn2+ transporter
VFLVSSVAAAITFFVVGGMRSFFTKKSFLASGFEMLAIGGVAAAIAYSIGWAVEQFLI